MKVLLTLDGGFSKTLFEGDKDEVKNFLKGYKEIMPMVNSAGMAAHVVKEVIQQMISLKDYHFWGLGAISRLENTQGKLEVVE